jgi:hypothetical protein
MIGGRLTRLNQQIWGASVGENIFLRAPEEVKLTRGTLWKFNRRNIVRQSTPSFHILWYLWYNIISWGRPSVLLNLPYTSTPFDVSM